VTGSYTAEIIDVPGRGIRLEPESAAHIPQQPSEQNLLALAIAMALGTAGYEHHPEPRDPGLQTIDALLDGSTTAPWRAAGGTAAEHAVVCERRAGGAWRCQVRDR
jgi:hypothetical protein